MPESKSRTGNTVSRCRFFIFAIVWLIVTHSTHSAISSPLTIAQVGVNNSKTIDAKKLQGKWKVYCFNSCDGNTDRIKEILPPGSIVNYTLVFQGNDKMKLELEGLKFIEWETKYDFRKIPVPFDFTRKFIVKKGEKVKTGKGILKLHSDHLIIHMGFNSRPSDFDQRKGLDSVLIKCKKTK